MKQFAIIGLGNFGVRVLEEMLAQNVEVLIIDRDNELLEDYKDRVDAAYQIDAIKEELIQRIVPDTIDAAVVDLGHRTEASILCTNYLSKMGVSRIITKAETDQHGQILSIVGATDVIYPNREAAKRITLPLLSSSLSSYFPISKGMVIAELRLPERFHGKTLIEADLRQKHRLNIIAVRHHDDDEYRFVDPTHRIQPGDTVLAVAAERDVAKMAGPDEAAVRKSIRKAVNEPSDEHDIHRADNSSSDPLGGSFLTRLLRGRR